MINQVFEHNGIKYKLIDHPKYKYELVDPYLIDTEIKLTDPVEFRTGSHELYGRIKVNGRIGLIPGYAWDGPSGPTFDTEDAMRGSLIHDALYQAMRTCQLNGSYRKFADDLFYRTCREDGMPWLRAWYFWAAVRVFGKKHATCKE